MTYTLIKLAFKVIDMANKASSDYLMSLCHSAYFHYIDDLVLVYAIVKADLDTSVFADLPTVEFDFNKTELKHINTLTALEVDYLNGVKERTVIDYGI